MIKRYTGSLLALAAAGLVGAQAQAQEEPAPVNTGKVSWTLGVDVVSEYWFRGIAQENQGWIVQPYASVTFGLMSSEDFSLDAYLGTWNSLHFDNPSSDGSADAWYESDFSVGLAMGLPYDLALDVAYINLYSPAGGDIFAEEINVVLSYDDSELMDSWGVPFSFNPHTKLAFEFDGGSDAGNNEGVYWELGVAPSFALTDSEDYPLTLSIPVVAGFSLDDYYEDANGDDEFFGYLDIGLVLSTPLSFIPADYGAWEASIGGHYLLLGDSTQSIASPEGFNVTDGDENEFYATFGISMSY